MKKEAVKTRPMARVKTESVGYHASGTGLVIGFGAFNTHTNTQNQIHMEMKMRFRDEIESIQRSYHGRVWRSQWWILHVLNFSFCKLQITSLSLLQLGVYIS